MQGLIDFGPQLLADLYHRFIMMAGYGNSCTNEVLDGMAARFYKDRFLWANVAENVNIMREFAWTCYDPRK